MVEICNHSTFFFSLYTQAWILYIFLLLIALLQWRVNTLFCRPTGHIKQRSAVRILQQFQTPRGEMKIRRTEKCFF